MTMADKKKLDLANKIADYLFTSPVEKRVLRLVMETDWKHLEGAGWGKEPLRDAVLKILEEEDKPKETPHYTPFKTKCAQCEKVLGENAVSSPVLAAKGKFFCDGFCARGWK
jgi:hypothetical protein